jgi:hypothetical protein
MVNIGNKRDKRDFSSEHKEGGEEEEREGGRDGRGEGDDNDDDGEIENFIVTTDASGNNSQMVLLPKKGNAQGNITIFYVHILYLCFVFVFYIYVIC